MRDLKLKYQRHRKEKSDPIESHGPDSRATLNVLIRPARPLLPVLEPASQEHEQKASVPKDAFIWHNFFSWPRHAPLEIVLREIPPPTYHNRYPAWI